MRMIYKFIFSKFMSLKQTIKAAKILSTGGFIFIEN